MQKEKEDLVKQIMKRIQKNKNKRQSGSDTINYLCEKAEKDLELKKEENIKH